jgi:hypothetical protein
MKHQNSKYILITLLIALFVTVPAFVFGGEKITICHNPDNPKTMTINENALEEHLAHGDQLGECPCPDTPCPASVKVVNGESEPIPVKGETTVSGSVGIEGTVNVNIEAEGTPDVSIKGTPDVNVVNDSSSPVPIIGQVEVTSQKEMVLFQEIGGNCSALYCGIPFAYVVPAGKMLTIEYFSCSSLLQHGEALSCYITIASNDLPVKSFYIQPTPEINVEDAVYYGKMGTGQQVKIYAPPLTNVSVHARKIDTPGEGRIPSHVLWSFSGYLEDVQ